MNKELVENAYYYAKEKHKGQKRKYTNEEYFVHPSGMAHNMVDTLIEVYQGYPVDEEVVRFYQIVCWLHDTVEDTDATLEEIEQKFGKKIAKTIGYLTNISKPEDGNRKIRKTIDMNHTLSGNIEAIIVKLFDIMDNCRDIVKYDKSFAAKYLREKKNFLEKVEESIAVKDLEKDSVNGLLYHKAYNDCLEIVQKSLDNLMNYAIIKA